LRWAYPDTEHIATRVPVSGPRLASHHMPDMPVDLRGEAGAPAADKTHTASRLPTPYPLRGVMKEVAGTTRDSNAAPSGQVKTRCGLGVKAPDLRADARLDETGRQLLGLGKSAGSSCRVRVVAGLTPGWLRRLEEMSTDALTRQDTHGVEAPYPLLPPGA
jgi:hypothetical protein